MSVLLLDHESWWSSAIKKSFLLFSQVAFRTSLSHLFAFSCRRHGIFGSNCWPQALPPHWPPLQQLWPDQLSLTPKATFLSDFEHFGDGVEDWGRSRWYDVLSVPERRGFSHVALRLRGYVLQAKILLAWRRIAGYGYASFGGVGAPTSRAV